MIYVKFDKSLQSSPVCRNILLTPLDEPNLPASDSLTAGIPFVKKRPGIAANFGSVYVRLLLNQELSFNTPDSVPATD
jgi:hypothetical protein